MKESHSTTKRETPGLDPTLRDERGLKTSSDPPNPLRSLPVPQSLESPSGTLSHAEILQKLQTERRRQRPVTLLLVSADVLLALLLLSWARVLEQVWLGNSIQEAAFASALFVWVGLRWLMGLYPGYGLGTAEELRRQTYATLATIAIIAVSAVFSSIGMLLWYMLPLVGLVVLGPLLRHFVKRTMKDAGLWGKPVVILSFGQPGRHLVRLLKKEWALGFRPIAIFDSRLAPAEGMIEGIFYGGSIQDALELDLRGKVDTAIFAMPHTRRKYLVELLEQARLNFRQVILIPNYSGVTNSSVVARDLAGIFGVEIRHNLLDTWTQRSKRAVDLLATSIGGILALPLILILCLLVWLESGRPIFYKDQRVGRDHKLFPCVKFRTMVPDAESVLQKLLKDRKDLSEEYHKYHKLREDPRVTRIGSFLRKTSLDELPQIWNVLKGEMSLVGPRPYLPRESRDVGKAQNEILRVSPGITGPWQVNGRNRLSFAERVQMDSLYVHNWSVWLDLLFLARTVHCVLFERGAY